MPIKKVYLELTNRCNLNCTICYRRAWDYKTYDMSKENIEKSIQEIKKIPSIQEVVLGGIGEPTFYGDICEVIASLKDYSLTMTTNGTIMNEEILETMVDNVDHIVISIDGMADTFYQIRGFDLEQIIENIKALNEMKRIKGSKTPIVSFQMVLSKTNKDEIFQVIDLAKSLSVKQVILSNMLPSSLEDQEEVLYELYENKVMKDYFNKIRNYTLRRGMEIKLPEFRLKTERRCRFIEDDTTMITAAGNIVPCYRFAHDQTEVVFGRLKQVEAHSFGKISEFTLQEIWESSAYKRYRGVVFDNHYPSCIDCDLVDGCDMVRQAEIDCYGNMPSCGDCLWSRKLIYCV